MRIKGNSVDAMSIFTIIGASNHSSREREENDFYATDPIAVEKLLKYESFNKNIWECACGAGHISIVLERAGYNVKSTDLVYRGYGQGGIDFLWMDIYEWDGDIITNPPYKYAQEFVEKALQIIPHGNKVAMLLRLLFLEGARRRKFFEVAPPKTVYVFSSRISCIWGHTDPLRVEDFRIFRPAIAYAWFVWVKGFGGSPEIRWID